MKPATLMMILTVAAVTILLRFAPFVIFRKGCPKFIGYLTDTLPYAVMALLVVYCLKDVDPFGESHALPEIISLLLTAAVHIKKNNILLSILFGTALYMILIRII